MTLPSDGDSSGKGVLVAVCVRHHRLSKTPYNPLTWFNAVIAERNKDNALPELETTQLVLEDKAVWAKAKPCEHVR